MAVAATDDAPATGAHHHGSITRHHSHTLPTSAPQLTDHLLVDDGNNPQHRSHCCLGEGELLPSFWRPKSGGDDPTPSAAAALRHAVVDWASVRGACRDWLGNPMNVALVLWLLCVGVSGGMFVLLLLGLLDGAFPAAADRNRWVEIDNQVLNALFTLMSVYQHPALCHHLFLLCRWRPADAALLRAEYCKDGPAAADAAAARPGDRRHIAVVVVLLHVTVVAQYILCSLYWGYTRTTRPELAEDGFFVLGIVAPVVAAVYTVCSPLGRGDRCHHELAGPEEAVATKSTTTTQPVVGHVVVEPEWAGGMFDCAVGGEDAATGCLALSCTCCVFGWNMERLGMGNACVHAVTFALLCFAPLWVLGVAALHIHDVVVGDAVGAAGVLLCVGGLVYGGYWRIQMRTRFGLPGSAACCGSMALTDYARWLFCWPCALAQEVRTANMYHVDGEVFYSKSKVVDEDDDDHVDGGKQLLLEVSNDRDVFRATDMVAVSEMSPAANDRLVVVHDETTMAPPVHQVVIVQVEDECSVVRHGETSGSSVSSSATATATASEEDDASLLESNSNQEMLEDADRSMLSDGSWREEKVKRLINMVTVVSVLIVLYTRGIIL